MSNEQPTRLVFQHRIYDTARGRIVEDLPVWEKRLCGIYGEVVYNRVFGYLPIYPYSLRRKVARWISDKIVPNIFINYADYN